MNISYLDMVCGIYPGIAIVLDFSQLSEWLQGGAALLSNDQKVLEKLRHSRSSYERKSDSNVNIEANGRISEFQCMHIADLLNTRGLNG